MEKEEKFKRLKFEEDYQIYASNKFREWSQFWAKWHEDYVLKRAHDCCKICCKPRSEHIFAIIKHDIKHCQTFEPGDFEYICQKTILKEMMEAKNVGTNVPELQKPGRQKEKNKMQDG